jgi:hypothetical protein
MTEPLSRDLSEMLQNAARHLDAATPAPSIFDPRVLQQRKVADMEHLEHVDDIDMEHFDNENATTGKGRPQRRRRRGSFLRIGAGALAGAVATVGFFIVRDGGLSSPAAQQVKTSEPETPYLLKFTKAPDGLCLQYANNMRDTPDEMFEMGVAPTVYKRGESDSISVQVNQYGGAPGGIIGETVDINGRKGLLTARNGNSSLSWKQGRTSVQMSAKGVKKDELLSIARSVVLGFDENGPRVANVTAPGFTSETIDSKMGNGFGSLGYGECDQTTFSNGPTRSIGVSTSPKLMEGVMFGISDPNGTFKETATTVSRNGKEVKAKLSESTYGGNDDNKFSTFIWTEKDVLVSVGFTKLDQAVVKEAIAGLAEASFDDYEALAKTAKQPTFQAPAMPGEAPRSEQKEIGTFKVGKSEAKVMSATQGEKLCVNINYAFGGGGGDCRGPSKEPTLTNNFGGSSVTIASGVLDAKITKAVASLPGGKTLDVLSFQDDRLPKLRVFVLVRGKDDPVPTAIKFYDAAGKVVGEQTSSDPVGVGEFAGEPVPTPTIAS